MGTLLLVRHGQASAFADNYDRLSSAGEAQSRLLGARLAQRGPHPTRIFCGPRERQRRTAELALDAAREAGRELPPIVMLDDLDEMRVDGLLAQTLPEESRRHHPHLRGLGDELLAADGNEARGRALRKLIGAQLALWAKGELHASGVETFAAFRARIGRALEAMRENAQAGAIIAAFTSGGAIGAVVQAALDCTDPSMLRLAMQVRNASVSELLFSGDRLTLSTFNEVSHLGHELITYI